MSSPATQQAPPVQPPPPPAAAAPTAAPATVSATPISVQLPSIQPQPQPPGPASGPQLPMPAQLLNLGTQPPLYRGPICWNSYCKDPDPNSFGRRGWKVRSGPPYSVSQFEQGIYCETFHSEEGGWRNCESCGRRVHCGCIVSIHKYQLRDAGGVDCAKCARSTRAAMAPPSPVWTNPIHSSQNVSDRKDIPVKSWRPPAGQISSQWRQTNLWSMSSIQSDLQQRLAFEFDRPSGSEKLLPGRTFIHAQERKSDDMHDRPITPAGMIHIMRERDPNGHGQPTNMDPAYSYTLYHRDGSHPNNLHDSSHHGGENDSSSSRKVAMPEASTSVDAGFKLDSHHPSNLKDDPPSLSVALASNFPSQNGPKDHIRIAPTQQQAQMASSPLQKQFYSHTVTGYNEFQAQMRNGRPRMDSKARSQLLPRYWPRITDQELQHLSSEYPTYSTYVNDSNSVITPLFEKMLSASDAGRIGRLVLPKKCAEAYFPPISQPEGLPLKVQDAGVTFSRIDPEGKLIMGFRKATNNSFEQEQATKPVNGAPATSEVNGKVSAPDSSPNAAVSRQNMVKTETKSSSPVEQATVSKMDKDRLTQKEGPGIASSSPGSLKRKTTNLGQKNKRLRMDNEESMELKITWEEAQELLRPPPKVPSIVIVDGHEFEEYEEPPILGRKTYFVADKSGLNHQWVQCEDCSKWRKVPIDALLPSKWTCFDNKWDSERSSCEPAQEISLEELAELIPIKPGKKPRLKIESDAIDASDGLDTLANLAILGEGEALPSQPTTKHPRHRPGCSCIVCIQPPSGKGPKHKQTCTCNVCMTVRRRFRTLMLRREKKVTRDSSRKKETGQSSEKVTQQAVSGPPGANGSATSSPQKADGNADAPEDMAVDHKVTSSPVKNHIDLNIQPERDDEQSPKSGAAGLLSRDHPT
ncbi:B3 domain-containing transcription factor VAL3 [Zea mays]|uniref:B3 domain-containing transcription factor VAL3 n=1 Tax=Zea mays TaxID=4577 RepID=A0A1D6EYA2_MAIZE|nr:B3 domain-containing transcription factor VAL3 [Zea mays]